MRGERRDNTQAKQKNGLHSNYLVITQQVELIVAALLKNTFVSIKTLSYFNGIDFSRSVQAHQCGDTYVTVKRLYFKSRNLKRRVSNFPV